MQLLLLLHAIYALCWLAIPSFFTRMTMDDFCFSSVVLDQGWFSAQLYWYNAFTPRLFATFLITSIGALTHSASHSGQLNWAVEGYLSLFILAAALFAHRHLRLPPLHSLLFAIVTLVHFARLVRAPDQALFWLAGSTTYFVPISLSIILIALSHDRHKASSQSKTVLCASLAFLAAGCNEAFSLVFLFSLLVWYTSALVKHDPLWLRHRILICTLSAAAMYLLMWLAPGNAARIQSLGAQPSWQEAFYSLLPLTSAAIGSFIKHQLVMMVGAFASFTLFLSYYDIPIVIPMNGRSVLVGGALFFVAASLYILPSAYIWQGRPPLRTDTTLAFLVLLSLIVLALAASHQLRSSMVYTLKMRLHCLFLVVAIVSLFSSLSQDWDRLQYTIIYVRDYDAQYQLLLSHPKTEPLALPPLPNAGFLHGHRISTDPRSWENMCVARYFGLSAPISLASGSRSL